MTRAFLAFPWCIARYARLPKSDHTCTVPAWRRAQHAESRILSDRRPHNQRFVVRQVKVTHYPTVVYVGSAASE